MTVGGIPEADRREIANVWAKYWEVLADVGNKPAAQVLAAARSVSTGPELAGFEESVVKLPKAGIAYFGTVTSRISWGPLSDGSAVIRDCMDQTKFGTYTVATKKAITIGDSREELHATFERVGGNWRVSVVFAPKDASC